MKKSLTFTLAALFAMSAFAFAAPDKAMMLEKEKAAWQAFKDKNEAGFKKVVDKDVRCVYDAGIMKMEDELGDLKGSDMKSFTISDFNIFSDEKDVVVATYVVKVEGSSNGKDNSGTYNAGTVWKKEGNDWLAIFHTNIKQAAGSGTDGAQKKE